MLKIAEVENSGIGKELGFEQGDGILAFDGHKAIDLLDYMFYDAQTNFDMTVLTKDGEEVKVEVEKEDYESLGLLFEDDGLKIRTCRNNCVFCFVNQMPEGMRETLYVKDDDYRQSFMHGNFITMTNVDDDDIERIIRLKLSPLYISVHAMRAETRERLMNNRFAGKIKDIIDKLTDGGIEIHAQIVLVKGINDGEELKFTLESLYEYKNVLSAAVVPCGITKFREGLYPVEDLTKEYALSVIDDVNAINKKHNGNKVRLADEFYFKAGMELPPYESYGDFAQVENGVGMSVKFRRDVEEIVKNAERQVLKKGKYLTISGTSAYKFITDISDFVAKSCKGVGIKVVAVENEYFGKTVNCTGLLTGIDIYNALKDIAKDYDYLLIPAPCLMQTEDRFLDNMTLEELSEKLHIRVIRAFLKD